MWQEVSRKDGKGAKFANASRKSSVAFGRVNYSCIRGYWIIRKTAKRLREVAEGSSSIQKIIRAFVARSFSQRRQRCGERKQEAACIGFGRKAILVFVAFVLEQYAKWEKTSIRNRSGRQQKIHSLPLHLPFFARDRKNLQEALKTKSGSILATLPDS